MATFTTNAPRMPTEEQLFEELVLKNIGTLKELNLASEIWLICHDYCSQNVNANSLLNCDEVCENVKKVHIQFLMIKEEKENVQEEVESLKTSRRMAIDKVLEIAKFIEKDKQNTDISKTVGATFGIAAAITAITVLAAPLAAAVILPMWIGGAVGSLLGNGTFIGTAIIEKRRLKKKIQEAIAVIDLDMAAFGRVQKAYEHLMHTIDEMVGQNLIWEVALDKKRFMEGNKELKQTDMEEYRRKVRHLLEGSVEKLCTNSTMVRDYGPHLASVVVTFALVTFWLPTRNKYDLKVVSEKPGKLSILSGVGAGAELVLLLGDMTMQCPAAAIQIIPHALGRVLTHGILAGGELAVNVVNCYRAIKSLLKKSPSKHAKAVRDAAAMLQQGLQELEEEL